jgi:hypothetical protein
MFLMVIKSKSYYRVKAEILAKSKLKLLKTRITFRIILPYNLTISIIKHQMVSIFFKILWVFMTVYNVFLLIWNLNIGKVFTNNN